MYLNSIKDINKVILNWIKEKAKNGAFVSLFLEW